MSNRPYEEHVYCFILDDDDYLTPDALNIMCKDIIEYPTVQWFAFDVDSKSPDIKANQTYEHNYRKLSFRDYYISFMYDDHFVWKRSLAEKYRFAKKFYKNGYEHIFYFQLSVPLILSPQKVKVIEYYSDGLTRSRQWKLSRNFTNIAKHIILYPRLSVYYRWLARFFLLPLINIIEKKQNLN